jgi:DNA-binding GntR family transcriptional regulator
MTDQRNTDSPRPFAGRPHARPTAHEYVRDTLRRAILRGEIPGGTRLVQADLAELLDVSTTPVREALRDLASEGLVRLDAHRGGVVHQPSADEIAEIYEIRRVLEPEAMRMAAKHISDEELDLVEAINERMRAATESLEFVDLNREFHLAIYRAAGSNRLVGILESLLDASVMYVSASVQHEPNLRTLAVEDHARIIAALRDRDAERAADEIIKHMRGVPQASPIGY